VSDGPPRWLQGLLEAKGAWNSDGVSRRARATFCRKCGAVVLRGLDFEPAGAAVSVDPTPLDAFGEAMALLHDRRTYWLAWRGDRYEINPRWPEHIRGEPAGTGRHDVLAEHRCHAAPLPADPRGAVAGPPVRKTYHSEGIPF
jgi:hypothetical protein